MPKCNCMVQGKNGGYYYNPAMIRLYIHVTENNKRVFKPVGWFCIHCGHTVIERWGELL